MPWIFFAVISVLSMSVGNLIFRVVMKESKSDAIAYNIVFQIVCTLLTGIFAVSKGFVPPPLQTHLGYFILSGILYAFGSIFMFLSVKYLEASDAVILNVAGTVVTIMASIFFLHESFSINKIIGTGLILFAIYIIQKSQKLVFSKGAAFAVASSVLMGLGVTVDAYILKSYNAISYTPIAFLIPSIILCLCYPKTVLALHTIITKKILRNIFFIGVLYSIQAVAYYLALEYGAGLTQLAPIFRTNVILTVLLAAIFIGERDYLLAKCISAVLVTVGVLLLM